MPLERPAQADDSFRGLARGQQDEFGLMGRRTGKETLGATGAGQRLLAFCEALSASV
jgi:hypothetical protein